MGDHSKEFIYKTLVNYGQSPITAQTIALDFVRGQKYAVDWFNIIKSK